ncbi:prepilin-type N-terminal cleavage/methylation domain-containing protein [Shewanella cyperi]|uniref:Prepilin-type N-terminal cleavage/methylation domain-containing protein n=1 Tax=Shewanella cyperi TaxID=2814292 RepID=A0A974XJR5_9GAMM|nr:prepilin-type N-terminal cleavage/methylation domain-containing protein [Shewanella cyperi]QSX29680.1 prepilin-type N-terminal cleavage/methylation domain-containing protein [Shewanella cyperi]
MFGSHFFYRRHRQGFTLIELVTTILLIGILAVVALPRLLGKSDYSDHGLRSELISRLRQAQLMALNNTDQCVRIQVLSGSGYRQQRFDGRSGALCSGTEQWSSDWQSLQGDATLTLVAGGSDSFNLDFDALGRLSGNGCNGPCLQTGALQIGISREGYIYAL